MGVLLIFLLVWLVYLQWSHVQIPFLRRVYFPALILKILCGLGLGLLYYYYYQSGDTLGYYEQALKISHLGTQDFFYQINEPIPNHEAVRAIYFTRFVATIIFFTGSNYWTLAVLFSVLSFSACFQFVSELCLMDKKMMCPAVISFLFLPSFVFWSSGVLKESLAVSVLIILFASYIRYRRGDGLGWFYKISLLLAALILIFIKYYIAAVALPLLGVAVIIYRMSFVKQFRLVYTILIVTFFAVGVFVLLPVVSPNLSLNRIFEVIDYNHSNLLSKSHEDAQILPFIFDNQIVYSVANVFHYLFSGIIRPFIWEAYNWLSALSAMENIFVLFLIIKSVFIRIKSPILYRTELVLLLVYVASLSLLLTYSAPNFGNLARYKVYYLPFLIFVLNNHILFNNEKWDERLKHLF